MAFIGLVVLNGAVVASDSGVPMVDCCELGESAEDRVPYGELPMFQSLGVSSLPAPPSENNSAYAEGVAVNVDGAWTIVGARDARSGDVIARLGPGETALHSTGEGFDSRVFCKDQLVAVIVGNDTVFVMDRKNKKISMAGFGHVFEMSESNGICLAEKGGAALILKDGQFIGKGKGVLIGENANSPALHGTPASPIASTSVKIAL